MLSSGERISVSGVRSSWLTLVKKSSLASSTSSCFLSSSFCNSLVRLSRNLLRMSQTIKTRSST